MADSGVVDLAVAQYVKSSRRTGDHHDSCSVQVQVIVAFSVVELNRGLTTDSIGGLSV